MIKTHKEVSRGIKWATRIHLTNRRWIQMMKRSEFQKAAGKLISVIQREWGEELENSNAEFSEKVMDSAHDILQAGSPEKARELLGPLTIRQYLGGVWVQSHP